MNASLPIVSAVIGAVVLLFGKKLFWLCVAALGFAAGVELAPHIVQQPTPLVQLSIALVLGFLGALLALLLQKLAIGVLGFVAGGRLAVGLAATFTFAYTNSYWMVFVIGGILGAVLLIALFDWALILLSSLIGAHLIVGAITLPPTGATILLMGLLIVGVFAQATAFRRSRRGLPA
ncbi:MAG: DUF4203 domain-containing protein [Chthoniobacterales bacterium]|nr:DUF4203 domain-containing protein [Chthoniobacterales bacterium]